jgi:hypothetical protein
MCGWRMGILGLLLLLPRGGRHAGTQARRYDGRCMHAEMYEGYTQQCGLTWACMQCVEGT